MFYAHEHGGLCCGIVHIFNFLNRPTESSVKLLKELIEKHQQPSEVDYADIGELRAIEVCLTDWQLCEEGLNWAPTLKKLGFIRTVRFPNPNSCNYVNQFMLCDNETDNVPYDWS